MPKRTQEYSEEEHRPSNRRKMVEVVTTWNNTQRHVRHLGNEFGVVFEKQNRQSRKEELKHKVKKRGRKPLS